MHKQIWNGRGVALRDFTLPQGKLNRLFALLFLVFCALCIRNFTKNGQHYFFFSLFSFLIGSVCVSGNTVMAAQDFIFSTKKIEKLKNNINQLQLASGHFPETLIPNQPGSPFLFFLWFSSGNFLSRLPVFYCPQMLTQRHLERRLP